MVSSLGMFGYHVVWEAARPTLVGIAVGVAMLWVFYRAVRTNWPVSYAALGPGDYGVVVNRGAARYFVFALAPVYVVTLIVGTTVHRQAGHGMACALGIGVVHVLRTQVRSIFITLRVNHSHLRNPTILYAVTIGLGVMAVAFLAGLGPGPAGVVVPQPAEFFNALWTTAFVALLAVQALQATNRTYSPRRAIERSRAETGPRLIALARQVAKANGVDELLVLSVLLTENLQRPRWFRALERLKGRLFPRGSYGVMQVYSDRVISDEESIRLGVAKHLAGKVVVSNETGYPVLACLRAVLRSYNDDDIFVEMAEEIYRDLYEQRSEGASWLLDDQQAVDAPAMN